MKLILNTTAVAARIWGPPSYYRSIRFQCGKGQRRCLDVLHVLQLVLHFTAVATISAYTCGWNRLDMAGEGKASFWEQKTPNFPQSHLNWENSN